MRKIRIGNDIKVVWAIKVNGGKGKLSDLQGTVLELQDAFGWWKKVDFTIENDSVVFTWSGKEQKKTGRYTLTFWANFGKEGQAVVDCCDFVNLVSRTCESDGCSKNLDVSSDVSLDGELSLGVQGKSAYRVWLDNGHEGTETDFLEWLRLPSTEAANSAAYLQDLGDINEIKIES